MKQKTYQNSFNIKVFGVKSLKRRERNLTIKNITKKKKEKMFDVKYKRNAFNEITQVVSLIFKKMKSIKKQIMK